MAAGTGSSATMAGASGQGGTTGTGDVGRTTPLMRGVTGSPVTTRTDTGDFGSSSVNKRDNELQTQRNLLPWTQYDCENIIIGPLRSY